MRHAATGDQVVGHHVALESSCVETDLGGHSGIGIGLPDSLEKLFFSCEALLSVLSDPDIDKKIVEFGFLGGVLDYSKYAWR